MRRRRQKGHVSHDRWLVSYADFITLLFAFFVVLYSASKADSLKQVQVAAAIDSAFRALGLFQGSARQPGMSTAAALAHAQEGSVSPVNIIMGDDLMAPPAIRQDFERIKRELEGLLSNQIAQHTVSVRIGRDGLVISLREAGFYDSGSANPHPGTLPILGQIAAALRQTPYDLRIEGHTDNVPIHTDQFESNWELSTARATHLARIFIVNDQYTPERLSASGYAEFHPVAPNTTLEGRGQNRRVDIVVLPRTSLAAPPLPVADKPRSANPTASRIFPSAQSAAIPLAVSPK